MSDQKENGATAPHYMPTMTQDYSRISDTAKAQLADTLAHGVRAWSESSIRAGLSAENKDKIEEIYKQLREKFYETPRGLPYEYCLLELVKR